MVTGHVSAESATGDTQRIRVTQNGLGGPFLKREVSIGIWNPTGVLLVTVRLLPESRLAQFGLIGFLESWMNREMRRASEREGRRRQAMPWSPLRELTWEEKQNVKYFGHNFERFDKVVCNNRYVVFVKVRDRELAGHWYDRVMSRRCDAQPICSWSDLFRIKNELFGEEVEAIQFLPKKSELVDAANLYWFFVRSE
jgi:hypothetical protein